MRIQKITFFLFALLTTATLCAQQHVGDATYYHNKFHGRLTSDGSRYHKDSLTCAHRTYPFGTMLKVRNPKNGNEVIVKVTDRGPFRRGAIVDLSEAAAEEIDMIRAGVARVEVSLWDGMQVPYRGKDRNLPDLKLPDPETGVFYTMPEWHDKLQRSVTGRAMVRNFPKQIKKQVFLQDTIPRWRVVREAMTAYTNTDVIENFDYVKRYPALKGAHNN